MCYNSLAVRYKLEKGLRAVYVTTKITMIEEEMIYYYYHHYYYQYYYYYGKERDSHPGITILGISWH